MTEKPTIKLTCKRCSHSWVYGGKLIGDEWKKYVTCPRCRTLVKIQENPTGVINKFIKKTRWGF